MYMYMSIIYVGKESSLGRCGALVFGLSLCGDARSYEKPIFDDGELFCVFVWNFYLAFLSRLPAS